MKFVLLTAWFVVVAMWMFNHFHQQNLQRDLEWKRKRDAEKANA